MRSLVCAGLLFTCAFSQHALAQDETSLHVAWNAPDQCGSPEDVTVRVVDQLGHMAMPAVSVRVYVVAQASALQMAILVDLDGVTAVREIEARDCRHAVEIASVVVALALQEHQASTATANPEHASQLTPRDSAQPPQHVEMSPREHREPPLRLAAQLAFMSSVGTAPNPAFGFTFGVRAALWHWSISLRAIAQIPVGATLSSNDTIDSRFTRTAGVLSLGYAIRLGDLSLTPSLGVSLGDLHGEGIGLANAAAAHRLWLAPLASVQLEWPLLDNLALSVAVDGELPAYRPVFSIVGAGAVFQPPPFVASASIGVTWTFL